jgi:hypothetical protein
LFAPTLLAAGTVGARILAKFENRLAMTLPGNARPVNGSVMAVERPEKFPPAAWRSAPREQRLGEVDLCS